MSGRTALVLVIAIVIRGKHRTKDVVAGIVALEGLIPGGSGVGSGVECRHLLCSSLRLGQIVCECWNWLREGEGGMACGEREITLVAVQERAYKHGKGC